MRTLTTIDEQSKTIENHEKRGRRSRSPKRRNSRVRSPRTPRDQSPRRTVRQTGTETAKAEALDTLTTELTRALRRLCATRENPPRWVERSSHDGRQYYHCPTSGTLPVGCAKRHHCASCSLGIIEHGSLSTGWLLRTTDP